MPENQTANRYWDAGECPRTHIIRAVHTDRTVRVYQAYNDKIADAALEAQTFQLALDKGLWSPKRMTWIKPSKIWMAYRCGWTVLKDANQARVLAIDLKREKFEDLLAEAIVHEPGTETAKRLRNQSVVVQWDPERLIAPKSGGGQVFTKPLVQMRSIQIGLRSPANKCLLDPQTVVRITDVTQDFRTALNGIQEGRGIDEIEAFLWPRGESEEVMSLPPHVEEKLGMAAKRKQAVVVLGCTANPPHQGHLHCLQLAQEYAEKEMGYDVLFSTVAIAPLGYVQSKSRNNNSTLFFDDGDRLDVLNLTAEAVIKQNLNKGFRYRAPTKTYGSAVECGRALRPSTNVMVIVAVGGDRFNWTKAHRHQDIVTLACARSDEEYADLKERMDRDIQAGVVSDPTRWQLITSVGLPISSTLVRTILTDQDVSLQQQRTELMNHGYPHAAVDVLVQAAGTK